MTDYNKYGVFWIPSLGPKWNTNILKPGERKQNGDILIIRMKQTSKNGHAQVSLWLALYPNIELLNH